MAVVADNLSVLIPTDPAPPIIDLRRVLEVFEYVAAASGLFLNGALCWLILAKTTPILTKYKPILLQSCLSNSLFLLANLLVQAQLDYKQGNLFFLINGVLAHAPYPWNAFLLGFWIFALFSTVTGTSVQYVYRYCIVVRRKQSTRKEYYLLLLLAAAAALTLAVVWTAVAWPHPDVVAKKTHLLARDSFYYRGVPGFLAVEVYSVEALILLALVLLLVGGTYSIIVYTWIKIFKRIKSSSHLTSELLDSHRQLTATLLVQATAPLALCLAPLSICTCFCLVYVDITGLGMLVTLVYSWIPVVTSVATLTAIKSYRLWIRNVVTLQWNRITPVKHLQQQQQRRIGTAGNADDRLHELNFHGRTFYADNNPFDQPQ